MNPSSVILVFDLPEKTAAAVLAALHLGPSNAIDIEPAAPQCDVTHLASQNSERNSPTVTPVNESRSESSPEDVRICGDRYACVLFGKSLSARTLAGLFGQVVDQLHDLDPAVLLALSDARRRSRRYVARAADGVHPGRADLPVMQTRSGWWISRNVSRADTEAALRATCAAARLEYGRDLIF